MAGPTPPAELLVSYKAQWSPADGQRFARVWFRSMQVQYDNVGGTLNLENVHLINGHSEAIMPLFGVSSLSAEEQTAGGGVIVQRLEPSPSLLK